ncbi:helix-turn-helix transcriptional regulator [Fructilactobacillus ixorae]|uniref:Helix-turn-helix transcriptional regulator n=1 Tax=Fructilactobacillus ixorae TaxID=1750535 RepID=A0ABY5C4T0_9LACO|nr:helix-turn-helix transcriptional regulator [Fructilactobacillus ixorae]USS93799.1 helix-turn-helix transcriptional regulator [Fructilactobacillus ixorae]
MIRLKLKNPERLREQIALNGFTLSTFAKNINSSPDYLGKIIHGKVNPGPNLARKIATGIGLKQMIFFC